MHKNGLPRLGGQWAEQKVTLKGSPFGRGDVHQRVAVGARECDCGVGATKLAARALQGVETDADPAGVLVGRVADIANLHDNQGAGELERDDSDSDVCAAVQGRGAAAAEADPVSGWRDRWQRRLA